MQALRNIKFYSILLSLIFGCAVCFDVPVEWRESIKKVCLEAEKGIFLHPFTDAKTMNINNNVDTQVSAIHYAFSTCAPCY